MIELEKTILRNLLTNEPFMRKVLPFVQKDYFEGIYRELFNQVVKYVAKYNKLPSQEAFKIELDEINLNDEMYTHALDILPDIFTRKEEDNSWLLDTTEKWCQDKAVYNAIMESIQIIDNKHQKLTKNAIPEVLQKALSVCFDTNVGHDYFLNVEERYDFYHEEDKILFYH